MRNLLKLWTAEETLYAVPGRVPRGESISHRLLHHRLHDANYRRAEGALLTHPHRGEVDPLQSLRVDIARGKLREARRACSELDPGSLPGARAELLLESARLWNCEGEWALAVRDATQGLETSDTSAITRMSLLQVRALAFYELAEIGKSAADVEEASSLESLFPNAPSAFYLRVLRAKIQYALGELESARTALLRDVRESFSSVGPNCDRALSLLRIEIDYLRKSGRPIARHAVASARVAAAMGDSLYEGLAYVDLLFSECPEARRFAETALRRIRGRFRRVDSLLEAHAPSLTARNLREFSAKVPSPLPGRIAFNATLGIWPAMGWVLNFGENTVEPVILHRQSAQILALLDEAGPISKEDLFKRVWKINAFLPERHDGAIRTALRRLRQQSGMKLATANSQVSLVDSLVIR